MNPILTKNYDAGGAIAAHRFVKFSADYTATQAAAATDPIVGVSDLGCDAAGDRADVYHAGIVDLELGGTVTRGDPLTADADGKGVKAAPATAANDRIGGIAIVSGVTGDLIPCLISLGSLQG